MNDDTSNHNRNLSGVQFNWQGPTDGVARFNLRVVRGDQIKVVDFKLTLTALSILELRRLETYLTRHYLGLVSLGELTIAVEWLWGASMRQLESKSRVSI
jgi:hypothetical protein